MSGYEIVKEHGQWIVTHPDKHGAVHVIGNGHLRETFYAVPDWDTEEHEAFVYRGETYFLSEFMRIDPYAPEWMRAFDGIHNDSFFSGILVKYSQDPFDDGIKVYSFYS